MLKKVSKQKANERLRTLERKEFRLRVSKDPSLLKTDEGKKFLNNEEIAKTAVSKDGMLFPLLSKGLQNKRTVALYAVKQNGMVLEFLNKELKKDKEIVLEAIKSDGRAIQFISESTILDYTLAITAVKQDSSIYKNLPYEYKLNTRIAKLAIQQNGLLFANVPDALKDNFELAKSAINTDFRALENASPSLQRNPSLLLEVISKNPIYFSFFYDLVLNKDENVLNFLTNVVKKQSRVFFDRTLKAMDTIGNTCEKEFTGMKANKHHEHEIAPIALVNDFRPEAKHDFVIHLLLKYAKRETLEYHFKCHHLKKLATEERERRELHTKK